MVREMRAVAFLLCLLMTGPILAQRLLHWHQGQTRLDRATPTTPSVAQTDWNQPKCRPAHHQWLHLSRQGGMVFVQASNPLPVDVRAKLLATADTRPLLQPSLPIVLTLAPGQCRTFAWLNTQSNPLHIDVQLHIALLATPSVESSAMIYQLPFAQLPIHISQGYGGTFSHYDPANRYAVDFVLPKGAPILAARSGIVLEVRSGFGDTGRREDGGGNLIRILHSDNTVAVYAHLDDLPVALNPGDHVATGQIIGHCGQSGFSTGSHLHFAIQISRRWQWLAIPFRMQTAKGELKFAEPMTLPTLAASIVGDEADPGIIPDSIN